MSEFRDGVFCGLGLALTCIQHELERAGTTVEGRELLRTLRGAITASGAKWSLDERADRSLAFMGEEDTPA